MLDQALGLVLGGFDAEHLFPNTSQEARARSNSGSKRAANLLPDERATSGAFRDTTPRTAPRPEQAVHREHHSGGTGGRRFRDTLDSSREPAARIVKDFLVPHSALQILKSL